MSKAIEGETIALALSGGGVRGAGHIGAIRAITEAGYRVCALSGCSFGALVAVAYAAGCDMERLTASIPQSLSFRHARPGLGHGGLLSIDILKGLLKPLHLPERLEDLPIPVTINATDLNSGSAIYFNKGPLEMLVAASCCLPGLMTPVLYEGMVLVDGGVVDVLPIAPLKDSGLPIWAIHTNAYPAGPMPEISTRLVLERMGQLVLCRQAQTKREQVDRFIEPTALGRFRMLDWHLARQIVEEGYVALRAELKPTG